MITRTTALHITDIVLFQLAQVEAIANHAANLPGRKALIWFCDQTPIPDEPPEGPLYYQWFSTLSALQRAQMAVYPVNCMPGRPVASTSLRAANGAEAARSQAEALSNVSAPQVRRKDAIAALTGGRPYGQYTDLGRAIRDAFRDTRCFYKATWPASNARPDAPIKTVELQPKNRKLHLFYPSINVDPVLPDKHVERLNAAERGLLTPLSANAIPMGAGMEIQTGRRVAKVWFDPRTVALEDQRGNKKGLLDVIFAYYNNKDKRIPKGQSTVVELVPKRDDIATFISHVQTLTVPLTVPPGSQTLRILIRDANTGAMGSTRINL